MKDSDYPFVDAAGNKIRQSKVNLTEGLPAAPPRLKKPRLAAPLSYDEEAGPVDKSLYYDANDEDAKPPGQQRLEKVPVGVWFGFC